jgi:hypothetical protein
MKKVQVWATGLFILGVLATGVPLRAQGNDQPKPPMYIYVAQWAVPRAQWGEMAKSDAADVALSEKLVTGGTLTGFGEFESLIHTEGQPTHGSWLTANSEEGIVKAVDAFMSQPGATAPVLAASQHFDLFLVSRIYNSRPGTYDGAYLSGSQWELKPGEFDDFNNLVKTRVVPLMEKMLADGVVVAYNLNYQEYATQAPNTVEFITITKDASGLDKMNKAFEGLFGKDPEIGPAMQNLVQAGSSRNFLDRVSHMEIK